MRKALIILAAAAAAASAGAVDVNPWKAKSDLTTAEPAAAVSGEQLKALWDNADWLVNDPPYYDLDHISTNDGTKYTAGQLGAMPWKWIMVKLKHSAKDHDFTAHWEAYTDSYEDYPCEVYVWNPGEQEWDPKDTGPKAIFTTPRSFTIETTYWVSEAGGYTCLILVQSRTKPGLRTMHVDVVDASY